MLDLKQRCAEWSPYDIKVPREWFECIGSVCSLIALAVLWCHTVSFLRSAASSQTRPELTDVMWFHVTWPVKVLQNHSDSVQQEHISFHSSLSRLFSAVYYWSVLFSQIKRQKCVLINSFVWTSSCCFSWTSSRLWRRNDIDLIPL